VVELNLVFVVVVVFTRITYLLLLRIHLPLNFGLLSI
jgi:hypothetical protein